MNFLCLSMHIYWGLLKCVLEEFWFIQILICVFVHTLCGQMEKCSCVPLLWSHWVTGRTLVAHSVSPRGPPAPRRGCNQVNYLHGAVRSERRFKFVMVGCPRADSVSAVCSLVIISPCGGEGAILLVLTAKIPALLWRGKKNLQENLVKKYRHRFCRGLLAFLFKSGGVFDHGKSTVFLFVC